MDQVTQRVMITEKKRSVSSKNIMHFLMMMFYLNLLSNEILFRNDFDSALSYLIGGDISEDSGFAIRPWKKIELIESNFIIDSSTNGVMGALALLPYDDENITKIAFTFILAIYDNHIKIRVHHSSPLK